MRLPRSCTGWACGPSSCGGIDMKESRTMAPKGTKPMHDWRGPGESDQYRQARNELVEAEVGLRRQIESVAGRRRKLPLGGGVRTDYVFEEWDDLTTAARSV